MRSILIVIALLATECTSSADTYRNEDHHFSLALGDQWVAMPPEVLRSLELLEQTSNPHIRVVAGFHRPGLAPLESPYVVVMANPVLSARKLSFDRFESEIRMGLADMSAQLKGPAKLLISEIAPGQIVFERNRQRAVARMKAKMSIFGSIDMLMYFYPGLHEGIQVTGYFEEKDAQQSLPLLNAVADSFHFDPGFEFGNGLGFWSREWDHKTRTFMGALIIGGVCGLLAPLAIRIHQRRRKPTSNQI